MAKRTADPASTGTSWSQDGSTRPTGIPYELTQTPLYNVLRSVRGRAYHNHMSSSLASTEPVPAIILAGGQALRMGGGDKCRLTLGGQTILGRVIHRLTAQTASLSLSANGDPGRFADYGLPVLPDPLGYDAGPLAGVLAGLDWAADMGFTSMVSVPGDTPFLPRDLVARLLDGAQETGYALAASPDPSGRLRRHPTCSVWAVNRREALRAALDNGLRKVGLWADQEQAVTVRFESSPFDPFFNINTPEDLARADTMCHAI